MNANAACYIRIKRNGRIAVPFLVYHVGFQHLYDFTEKTYRIYILRLPMGNTFVNIEIWYYVNMR